MPRRKSKRDEGAVTEGGEEVRFRSKTVMGILRGKLLRNRNNGATVDERELTRNEKCATLPARVRPAEEEKSGERGAGIGDSKDSGKTRTLYWMEEYLGPYEDSLRRSPGVTRKDSDESVDSGFGQTPKAEGSETDSNSSPAQSKVLLQASPSLSHEASGSFQEEPPYQLVPASSMYDEAAFDKAFGPMKDVGRWYSTYSTRQQLHAQQATRVLPDTAKRLPNPVDRECGPAVPVRVSSISTLDDYEQRLISRPLPPIPRDPRDSGRGRAVATVSNPPPCQPPSVALDEVVTAEVKADRSVCRGGDDTYELVEHCLRGTNPLMLGLRNVATYGWYWGPVTRVEAEEKLQGADDGTFLVRDSSDDRYLLSLSFRSQGKTLHTRIEYSNGFFSFYSFPDSDSEGYRSIVDLIEWSMHHSRAGIFCFSRGKAMGSPAVPVRLLRPLSRFKQVRSLQHYCRFVIRQSIRFDCIRQLPLPRHVHGYLEQSPF